MRSADHAVFLDRIGYGEDIAFACEQDVTSIVPVLYEEQGNDGMRAVLRGVAGQPHAAVKQEAPEERETHESTDPFTPFLRYVGDKSSYYNYKEDSPRYFFLGGSQRRREKRLDLAESRPKGFDEP